MISADNLPEILEKARQVAGSVAFVSRLREPYRVLVSTMLSARTKDEITSRVTGRLFVEVKSFRDMDAMDLEALEELIKPINFYRTKARNLKGMARKILSKHKGKVPETIDELVELPGVGRKTANLVVSVAFGKPGICVDTHVHRISNRWGLVRTGSPLETEMALRRIAPRELWQPLNDYLVPFGKEVCTPIGPRCSACPLDDLCPKNGVKSPR